MAAEDPTLTLKVESQPAVFPPGQQTVAVMALSRLGTNHGVFQQTDNAVVERQWGIAGRVQTQSFARPRPGGRPADLYHTFEVGHGSVLQPSVSIFPLAGVSRSLTRTRFRHRAEWADSLIPRQPLRRPQRPPISLPTTNPWASPTAPTTR